MPDRSSEITGRVRPPRQALWGAGAMIALAAITTIVVGAYFVKAVDPWTWQGLVAIATVPFSLVCAGLLWRAPTRENAGAALLVIGFSLVRIGFPAQWTNTTYVLIVLTAAIAAPVVWAVRTLPP